MHTILVKLFSGFATAHFQSEVSIQKDIYDKTKEDQLCPAIVFDKMFIRNDNEPYLSTFITLCKKTRKICLIAMKFLDDYIRMDVLMKSMPDLRIAAFMAASFLLIELAHKTGYTQGDFKFNIFFKLIPADAEYPYFLTDDIFDYQPLQLIRRLKPIIIDFGWAKKIGETSYYERYEFSNLLRFICEQGCQVTEKRDFLLKQPDFYGWACGLNVKDTQIFFKNSNRPKGIRQRNSTYYLYNLTVSETTFLNDNFNGENGIMNKIIIARDASIIKKNLPLEIPELHPSTFYYGAYHKTHFIQKKQVGRGFQEKVGNTKHEKNLEFDFKSVFPC